MQYEVLWHCELDVHLRLFGHAPVLQSVALPLHSAPPLAGVGLVHVRLRDPPRHELVHLHTPQLDHAPSTGAVDRHMLSAPTAYPLTHRQHGELASLV